MCIYVYMYTHMCVYIYMYICICIYIYIYIHIFFTSPGQLAVRRAITLAYNFSRDIHYYF